MQIDFLVRAYLASFGVALLSGPLGTLMIWRRMAYLGDVLAHSTLLGVGVSLLLHLNPQLGSMCICLSIGGLTLLTSQSRYQASDTMLGVLSHGSLALGLVVMGYVRSPQINLVDFLFGDVLSISTIEIWIIYGLAFLAALLIIVCWRPLMAFIIDEDLAFVEGIPIKRYRMAIVLGLALVLSICMRLVGALLITALMVIPAASARYWAKGPASMIIKATLIASLSCVSGLYLSTIYDWPSGPAMVVMALVSFVLSVGKHKFKGLNL